jgi:hypothetical protein
MGDSNIMYRTVTIMALASIGLMAGTLGPALSQEPSAEAGWTPYMVAFDAGGNVRWSVANEQAQIATDDGGVIGQSGVTYDQNGNAMGQMGTLPTYSWLGNAYQIGSVDQVAAQTIHIALSWWAAQGGNQAGNWTAIRQQGFPELKSCKDKGGSCAVKLGPRDLLWNARNDLVNQLEQDPACQQAAQMYVYSVVKAGGLGFFEHPLTPGILPPTFETLGTSMTARNRP